MAKRPTNPEITIHRLALLLALLAVCLSAGCEDSGWPGSPGRSHVVQSTLYDTFDVSPDGRKIVFAGDGSYSGSGSFSGGSSSKNLYLLDLPTQHLTRLTNAPDFENYPAFSPDGKSIVYQRATALDAPRYLFIRSLDGTHVRQLTSGTMTNDEHPSFSHDGKKIVFSRADTFYGDKRGDDTWDCADVYVIHTDGSSLHRLTRGNYSGMIRPKFSPDGSIILFEETIKDPSDYSVQMYISQVNADGKGTIHPVVAMGSDSYSPAFFPGGHRIVFGVNDGDLDLYSRLLSGGTATPLHTSRDGNGGDNPVVTHDGKSIFFLRGGIWQMNADGSNQHQIIAQDTLENPMHLRE